MILMVIVFYFVAPAYVIDQWGSWKGLSSYKNTFGEYMAVAVVLLLLVRFRHFRWLRYVFLIIAAVLLMLSRSAGALLCCVLVVAAMPLWRLTCSSKGKRQLLVCALTAAVISLVIGFIPRISDSLFQILGRDSTLTGRTHLWRTVLPAILKHPILGYGYGAFWTGLKGEALDVWIATGWLAPLADNGYLDLCLSLGLLGLCAFVYVLVDSFRKAVVYLRSEPGPIGLWPITYLGFFTLHNVIESTLLTSGTFPFLVFAMITTSLAVSERRAIITSRNPESQPVMMREWKLRPLSY
jgi:exopolysaccharide production protein ExoQ